MSNIIAESERALKAFNVFLKQMYDIEPLEGTEIVKDMHLQQLFEGCLFNAFLEGQRHESGVQKEKGVSSPLETHYC